MTRSWLNYLCGLGQNLRHFNVHQAVDPNPALSAAMQCRSAFLGGNPLITVNCVTSRQKA